MQVLVDGTNSNMATVALGYAEQIVRAHGLRDGSGAGPRPIDLRERAWFNPALVSRNYNVPAVIGTIMLIISLLLTALAVVREREIGTLEQLMVSPLTPRRADRSARRIPFAVIALLRPGADHHDLRCSGSACRSAAAPAAAARGGALPALGARRSGC